jgi:hypothetical protein
MTGVAIIHQGAAIINAEINKRARPGSFDSALALSV